MRRTGRELGVIPPLRITDRTTHSLVTGFMEAELMYGQKQISSWAEINWKGKMSREELLAARIRQLQRIPEAMERAKAKLHAARERNKDWVN